jgi:ActR/RegA family two-component response regulator
MRKASVLVVDDRKNWRDAANDLLAPEFEVELADSYQSAIDKIKEQHPPFHVLVADIRLNDGDPDDTSGLDVIAFAQQYGGYTNAIVWTAFPTIETAERAFRGLAVFAYVPKNPHPDSGEWQSFDVEDFVLKVCEAADAAMEKQVERATRVLLVESDSEWQHRLTIMLEEDGYSVDVVEYYDQALEQLKLGRHKLIITDIAFRNQPADRGLNFIEHARANSPGSAVVIVSDASDRAIMRRAFAKLGVLDFLPKTANGGFDSTDLKQVVREIYRPIHEVFIVAEFSQPASGQPVRVGQEYALMLTSRKYVVRPDRAVTVWLPPHREAITLDVTVYVEEGEGCMRITPLASRTWTLPTKAVIPGLAFGLTPLRYGSFTIKVELFGPTGWWRQLEQTVAVEDPV